MAKKQGRPRRDDVPRGQGGRIKSSYSAQELALRREQEEARLDRDARSLAQWRRVQEIVDALLPDTRLATPLGRMLLLGKPIRITLAQYEAAERLFSILQNYDRLVLGANRDPKALDLGGAHGRTLRDEPDPELVASARSRLERCEQIFHDLELGAAADPADDVRPLYRPVKHPSAMWAATKDVVRGLSGIESIRSVTEHQTQRLALAVEGLTALAKHWRLDEVKAQKIRRSGGRAVFDGDGRPVVFLVQRGVDGHPTGNTTTSA